VKNAFHGLPFLRFFALFIFLELFSFPNVPGKRRMVENDRKDVTSQCGEIDGLLFVLSLSFSYS